MKTHKILYLYIAFTLALSAACSAPAPTSETTPQGSAPISSPSLPAEEPTEETISTSEPAATEGIPVTGHLMTPAEITPSSGKLIYDVESSGTAAPYGDSYKLNRFERPFLKDMTYVSDMDIVSFNLSQDADWYYVSIELSGNDPNNSLGINYGVEIDLDADGFGDYLLWAHPPYAAEWNTSTVQVFNDSDRDSGGESSLKSDAVFNGNGYETLVFDGGTGQNADPDLAWVRIDGGPKATIQFAFKKSLTGSFFMLGVVSDAGLKDISRFDYNDHFQETEAGSPIQNKTNYPLGLLYAVDNTCWEAYGLQTTGYEPKLCPVIVQPTLVGGPEDESGESPMQPEPSSCDPQKCGGGPYDPGTCECL